MAEQVQFKEEVATTSVRPLQDVLKEVAETIQRERGSNGVDAHNIKDLRWKFDQVSALMNQAIYNDQKDQIHSSCLKTVAVLVEILARS